MSDAAALLVAGPDEASRLLTARAGRMARMLADVVERIGSADAGADRAAAFLREWAGSTTAALPLAGQPLDRLGGYFGLGPDERDLLVLAGLPEEHEGLAGTFRALHPYGEARPTAGLAALVLADGVDRVRLRGLLGAGPAVRHGLLRLTGPGGIFERSLVPAEAIWEALHGVDAVPGSLARVPLAAAPAGLDGWLDDVRVRRAAAALVAGEPVTVLLSGLDEDVALGRVHALAATAGARPLAARLTADDDRGVALLVAHAAARGAVPVVAVRAASDGPPVASVLAVGDVPGPVVVLARTGTVGLVADRPVLTLPAGPVAVADRRTAWRVAVPGLDDAAAAALAVRHPIDPVLVAQVGLDARAEAVHDDRAGGRAGHPSRRAGLDVRAVAGLIRRRANTLLPPAVQLVTPSVAWSRLVLPAESAARLAEAVSRLEHQATVLDGWRMRERAGATAGVRLLFTGPPGTGKSLAAQAIATAASTDLLRVDVSQTVSKWIGETEKNLAAAFEAAERTQAVLFIDEADALFGTRTQISDAHDRYANTETAFLLQRLDAFEGLAVLATNLRHNIDPAFSRRMDYVVEFPLPDEAGRRELWRLHLPAGRTAPDVDVEALARLYAVPGGWIRNAAVAASFVAAAASGPVRQDDLVAAVRREYDKAAVPFPGEPPRSRDDA